MEIEGTTFGTITIDGKTYEHDVIIRLPPKALGLKVAPRLLVRADEVIE